MAKTPRGWTGARTPSAIKRVRQAERRRAVNQRSRSAAKTYVATAMKVATGAVDGDTAEALAAAMSALDKAAKVGVIHPNAAARRKSRLAIKLNALEAGDSVQTTGRVAKTTGAAAAVKAARNRIASGKAAKAKGPQTAAGKARAALSKTARTEAGRAETGETATSQTAPAKVAPAGEKAPAKVEKPAAKVAPVKASARAEKPAAKPAPKKAPARAEKPATKPAPAKAPARAEKPAAKAAPKKP